MDMVKPDMAALRAICDGHLPQVKDDHFAYIPANQAATELLSGVRPMPPPPNCVSCEAPLEEGRGKMAGKFACGDEACGMYGKEQKGRK